MAHCIQISKAEKSSQKYSKQKTVNLQFASRAQPCAAADLACGQEVRRPDFSKTRKICQVTLIPVRPAKPLSAVRWANSVPIKGGDMKRSEKIIAIIAIIILCSCSVMVPKSTPTPILTSTPSKTITLLPTNTITSTVTLTSTPTITLSPTITVSPTSEKDRYFERAGNLHFSYVPPKGWQKGGGVVPYTGWKGSCKNFGCYLSFQELGSSNSAEEAANNWTTPMFTGVEYEILSEEKCIIESGLDCYQVTVKWKFIYNNSTKDLYTINYYIIINRQIIQAGYTRDFDNYFDQDQLIKLTVFSIRKINE
jgi:hypothetical protein